MSEASPSSDQMTFAGLDPQSERLKPWSRAVQVVLLLLFVITLVRTAWVNDDAYITLRTVDNLVNGYGLTWNPGERVQAYTHPLWMFLLAGCYAITREAYFTTLALSFVLSTSAVLLVSRCFYPGRFASSLGILVLCLSPAFIEYSTSGLENPLTYLLLTLFLVLFFKLPEHPSARQVFLLGLIASLAMVNRLDSGLLYLPALLWIWLREHRWKTLLPLALSAAPLVTWEAFSLVYYGFLLPNTAYAKLNTGVAQADLFRQGWLYFLNGFTWDPLTLLAILAGIAVAFVKGGWREKALSAGVILALLYILAIGGDFMSGRFFAAPLLAMVIVLVRLLPRLSFAKRSGLAAAIILLGFLAHSPTLLSLPKSPDTAISPSGIADERGFYFNDSGLIHIDWHAPVIPNHPWARDGLALRERGGVSVEYSIGYLGYFAGPGMHLVDQYALADPLLARLPIPDPHDWRIGHFIRPVPQGYVETLQTGANQIQDPNLRLYYDKLKQIIRGELFDPQRLSTIVQMNLGKYDDLIQRYLQGGR